MQQIDILRTAINSLKSARDAALVQVKEHNAAIEHYEKELSALIKAPPSKTLFPDITPLPLSVPTLNIKKSVFAIFDQRKRPLKLMEVQDIYKEATGKDTQIREYMRGMNKKGELKIMKINNSNKNAYWLPTTWVDEKGIKSEYKWEDFDNMYSPEDISYV